MIDRSKVGLALGGLVTTGLLFLALSTPPAHAGELTFPRPQIVQWSLANGLDVVYVGVHKTPLVTVQVWYHVGSKDEPRNRRGSAHMFEHIMFKGTEHVPPEDHARLLDRIGGIVNAFTTEDVTAFHDTVPRQYMGFAMQLEAERMQHLLFRKEMIDTEREVVKEEIRQRENNPIMKAFVRFRELAFTRHPYAWDPGGRIADLDQTTPADLKKFYQTYYQPNNATLIVVGDVSEQEVRAGAKKWFGGIARAPAPPRPAKAFPEPEQTEMREAKVEPGQIGVIIGGYKIPPARSDDMFPLKVLGSILSDGESSRLYKRIVRKDKAGVYAGVYVDEFEDPGLMLVFGVHLAPEQAEQVERDLLDEVARLQREPVPERELQKAKNQLASKFVDSLQEVSGLAWQIGASKIQRGDAKAWLGDYERILQVSAADVQRVAKKYLTPERLTMVAVPPGGAAEKGGAK